jgi:hypothetical protein
MTRSKPFTGRYWRHVRCLNPLTSAAGVTLLDVGGSIKARSVRHGLAH